MYANSRKYAKIHENRENIYTNIGTADDNKIFQILKILVLGFLTSTKKGSDAIFQRKNRTKLWY